MPGRTAKVLYELFYKRLIFEYCRGRNVRLLPPIKAVVSFFRDG